MKKFFKFIIFAGFFVAIGMGISLAIAEIFRKVSDDEFCGSCHIMKPMVDTWKESVHGGNNNFGIVAKCAACHTPHDSAVSYSWIKSTTGLRHTLTNIFNQPSTEEFIEILKHADEYVYDSGCLSCHKNIAKSESIDKGLRMVHEMYFKNKENGVDQQCTTCHKGIAHPGLKEKLEQMIEDENSNVDGEGN